MKEVLVFVAGLLLSTAAQAQNPTRCGNIHQWSGSLWCDCCHAIRKTVVKDFCRIFSFSALKHTVKGGTGLLHDHFSFDARYSNIRSDGFIDRATARMSSYYASAAYYGTNTLIKFQAFGNAER